MFYIDREYILDCYNDGKKDPNKFEEYKDGRNIFGEYRAFKVWLEVPKKIKKTDDPEKLKKYENIFKQYIQIFIHGEGAKKLKVGDKIEVRKILYVKRVKLQVYVGITIDNKDVEVQGDEFEFEY